MKEAIGSIEKAFQIIEVVCREKEFTSKLMAEKLKCDQRTARRYIQKMKIIFQGQIEEKKKGVYRWKGISDVDDKILDSPNIRLLYAFIELAKRMGSDKNFWKDVKSKFYVKCEEDLNKIILSNVISYGAIQDIKIKIEEAIKASKCIKYKYTKYNYYFTVEPYNIILFNGLWYLVCIDRRDNKIKTFAVDLIEDISILDDEPFLKKKNSKKVNEQLDEINTIFQISSDDKYDEVIIEVGKEVADFFRRKNIFYKQEILEDNTDKMKVKFLIKNKSEFRLITFGWIPFFKVIEPEDYKKFYIDMLNKALKKQKI